MESLATATDIDPTSSTIVVGVVPEQSVAVVTAAAEFAEQFRAELICASVDPTRYPFERRPDGSVLAMSVDPDLIGDVVESFDPALEAKITEALRGRRIRWSTRALAGGPARELARLAEELDAAMIVVGTREKGIHGSLHEFFNGSVAVQLAHRQHRPVVVVPLNPVGLDGELPWTSER